MRCEQLDVLVQFAPVDLVFDAVVREVDLPVEVRQVVVARPRPDLVLAPVGAAVTIGTSAVVLLQELLVLALQVLLQHDAPHFEPVVLGAEPGFLLSIGRVQVRVVIQFTFPADTRIERLGRLVVPVERVGIEQVSPLARQRQATLAVAEIHSFDEALAPQMFHGVVVSIEVALGHDTKGADSGQGAAVLAVQVEHAVAVHDQLALVAPRQIEVAHQAIAQVTVVSVPVFVHSRTAVAAFTAARVISRIEHGCPPDMALRSVVREGARAVAARGDSGRRRAPGALCRAAVRAGLQDSGSGRLGRTERRSRPGLSGLRASS